MTAAKPDYIRMHLTKIYKKEAEKFLKEAKDIFFPAIFFAFVSLSGKRFSRYFEDNELFVETPFCQTSKVGGD